jgi:predicted methyltransferase
MRRRNERWAGLMLAALTVALGCSSHGRGPHDPAMLEGRARAEMARLGAAWPRAQQQAAQQAGARATSTPYVGDPAVFDSPGREERLQIDRVMKLLGIGRGKNVADIGAGGGWFTVRAARNVGPDGVVYAEEINPAAVKFIADRAAKEKLANVRAVQGTLDDPKLPVASVDAVLMLKMYHEIARPVELVERLKPALRPGAKVGIIDRNGDGSGTDHGVPMATVVKEMGEAGFGLVGTYDFTKADGEDYFLIFEVR